MPTYIVDTSLYVAAITTDEGNRALARFQRRLAPFLFQHSTVAQETLSGALTHASYREYYEAWVSPFEDLGRVYTPTHTSWTRAALIVTRLVERKLVSRGGFERSFSTTVSSPHLPASRALRS